MKFGESKEEVDNLAEATITSNSKLNLKQLDYILNRIDAYEKYARLMRQTIIIREQKKQHIKLLEANMQ